MPLPRRTTTGTLARLGAIVLLGACAWYVWFVDPLNPGKRRAAQFCASVTPEMSPVALMQAATAKGATEFSTPEPGVLRVSFGDGVCEVVIGTPAAGS